VQSFVDIGARQEPVADYQRRTFDLDTQYHTSFGAHDLVTGAGYRFNSDRYRGAGGFSLIPVADQGSRVTAFVQDEVALFGDRLALSFGTQVQHDADAGAGLQPNARLMWKLRRGQRLWVAASRALRTPSRYERGIRVALPPVPTEAGLPLVVEFVGNPEMDTERFVDAETGYRLEIGPRAGLSATMFVGHYTDLHTTETGVPVVRFDPAPSLLVTSTFGNLLDATTRGVEAAGYWLPARAWRIDASYTGLRVTPSFAASSRDPLIGLERGHAPRHQWQLRSTFSPRARTTLAVALFHVGALEAEGVPSYTRADINAEWRVSAHLSAMVLGQNLLDPAHPEFAVTTALNLATEVRRSASVRLRWTF
jgi:iron complex outermembrane receptor protein